MAARQPTLLLLSHHQVGAILASGVDYSIMIVCVSFFGLSPVLGTIIGALCGAITSFTLGRRWIFDASLGDVRGQASRYALVALASLTFNALGEGLMVHAGVHYVLSRLVVAVVVGVGWNFPMHRNFVFRAQPGA
jgi:putative flippase GtrA